MWLCRDVITQVVVQKSYHTGGLCRDVITQVVCAEMLSHMWLCRDVITQVVVQKSYHTGGLCRDVITHVVVQRCYHTGGSTEELSHRLFVQRCYHTCGCTEMLSHSRCTEMSVGCLTSQQHASLSQGRICSDNFTCCHTEIEVADPTFHLTQSQYTDTEPASPSTDPTTPGAWQGSHWSANFEVTGMIRPGKIPAQCWDWSIRCQYAVTG